MSEHNNYLEFKNSIKSPEQLLDWMKKNIKYHLEVDDYDIKKSNERPTQTSEELFYSHNGHCGEQSYFEKDILENLGYRPKLVFVKENYTTKDYGYEGNAHVFVIYKNNDKYVWFEHSMEHATGIRKYSSVKKLFDDVAKRWWKYDKHSDILEFRILEIPITGISNKDLAKVCYKNKVVYTANIKDNKMEPKELNEMLEDLPMNNDEVQFMEIDAYPKDGNFYDVISQVKDIVYGFINKQTGERIDNRDFIHNHPNIRSIYSTNTDPCITIKNKLGICMDQSLAIKYLFNQLHPDYLCKLYALTKGRFGHCVPCICTPQGKWYYIENAWDKERGIHGPINSESAVKQYLTDVYDYRHSDVLDDVARVNDFNEGYLVESYIPLVENVSITPAQRKYSEYLIGHISNTKKGYFWIKENAPEMLTRCNKQNVENNLIVHDESKYSPEEYDAYSNYFYSKVRTPEIKKAFDLAWSHHWSHNKHHPEYWHGLPMPEDYIIEMICDWWSFSWKDGNLGEIFNFFKNVAVNDERKNMNPNTVKRVKELLDILHAKLVEKNLI